VIAFLLFSEVLSVMWCFGASLILVGVALMNLGQEREKTKKE